MASACLPVRVEVGLALAPPVYPHTTLQTGNGRRGEEKSLGLAALDYVAQTLTFARRAAPKIFGPASKSTLRTRYASAQRNVGYLRA